MNEPKWIATVNFQNDKTQKEYESWQRLDAVITQNGDLTIVRTHPDMYATPVIASYAAGCWESIKINQKDSNDE